MVRKERWVTESGTEEEKWHKNATSLTNPFLSPHSPLIPRRGGGLGWAKHRKQQFPIEETLVLAIYPICIFVYVACNMHIRGNLRAGSTGKGIGKPGLGL